MPKPPIIAKVIHGDCRQVIPTLGKFNFIFADPPFNIGQMYKGYNDRQAEKEFGKFMEEWIWHCWDNLLPNGVMVVHGNDDICERTLNIGRLSGMKKVGWVNWHYRFGECSRHNWIDSRTHALIYARSEDYTWNADAVLVESDRAAVYGDKRVNDSERGGSRVPFTVWGIPSDGPNWGRVQGNNQERRSNHPNQLPELYLARFLRAYTNPGDRVLDPFAGSGTTIAVANALGRNCWTIDISEENVASVRERIQLGAIRV